MKKLFTGIMIATVLFFGLASCGTDLHDAEFELSDLRVNGDFGSGVWSYDVGFPLVKDADGTYYYEFMATKSTHNFSLRPDDIWANAYRKTAGGMINEGFATGALDEEVEVFRGDNPDQMPTSFSEGTTYRIVVTDGGFTSIKVKIVKVADPIPMDAVFDDGTILPLTQTSASSWKGTFKTDKDGDYKYYLQNNIIYLDTDGNPTTAKPASGNRELKDYKANSSWEISVEVKGSGFAVETAILDSSAIGLGAFVGTTPGLDWDGNIKCATYRVSEDADVGIYIYEYKFTAVGSESSFTIQKTAGSWDDRWCGETNDSNCKDSGSSAVPGGEKVKMGRYNGGDPKHFNLEGMVSGNEYTVRVTVEKNEAMATDGADVYIQLLGDKAEEKPFKEEIGALRIIGIFTDWGMSEDPAVSDDGLTLTFGPFVAKDPASAGNENNPWGLCSDASWSVKYTGVEIALDGESKQLEKGNGTNNKITGLAEGDEFKIVCKINESDKTVTASAVKVE